MFANEAVKRLKRWRIAVLSRVRAAYLRLLGARVGRNVTFAGPVHTRFNGAPRRIVIEDDVVFIGSVDLRNRENGAIHIGRGCCFEGGLRLVAARESTIRFKAGCSAGLNLIINAGGNVTIGERCLFSSFVHINGSAHPTFRDEFLADQGYIQGWVEIGDDCWLANCVNVAMNTRIGKGVIVSANSVIGGVIDDYAIMMGSPARMIGQRLYRDPEHNRALLPAPAGKEAPGRSPSDRGPTVAAVDALDALRQGFAALFPNRPLPHDSEALRASGLLSSLDWAMFVEDTAIRFGVDLPPAVATAPAFDSFAAILDHLYPPAAPLAAPLLAALPRPLALPDEHHTLYRRFSDLAARTPQATVLWLRPEGTDSFHALRYEDLLAAIEQAAAFLAAKGIGVGQRVGIVMPLSIPLVALFLGCLRQGVVPSILAPPSPKVPPEIYARNHAAMFARMGLAALCTVDALRPHLAPLLDGAVPVFAEHDWSGPEAGPVPEPAEPSPDDVAVIQHSSGTTGVQKGVALSHGAVARQVNAYARTLVLRDDDVIVSWLPLYHDMGFVACFLLPLMTGVPVALFSPFDWIATPASLWDAVVRFRGTLVWLPNFAFNVLSLRTPRTVLETLDLSRVRGLVSCSEPVSAATMTGFRSRFAIAGLRDDALWCCYAMAENTFAVTHSSAPRIVELDPDSVTPGRRVEERAGGRAFVSQGRPLPNTRVSVIDGNGRALGPGEVGEVAILSDCMLTGYHENPEATAVAFIDGWYRTGDIGFLLDKELYVVGRHKDLIIVAGRNFHPQDIEAAVTDGGYVKPGRCCAFGVYNERDGTEEVVVVAERLDGCSLSDEAVIADARRRVAQELDCVLADMMLEPPGGLVKTSSGKLSRSTMRRHYQDAVAVRIHGTRGTPACVE